MPLASSVISLCLPQQVRFHSVRFSDMASLHQWRHARSDLLRRRKHALEGWAASFGHATRTGVSPRSSAMLRLHFVTAKAKKARWLPVLLTGYSSLRSTVMQRELKVSLFDPMNKFLKEILLTFTILLTDPVNSTLLVQDNIMRWYETCRNIWARNRKQYPMQGTTNNRGKCERNKTKELSSRAVCARVEVYPFCFQQADASVQESRLSS